MFQFWVMIILNTQERTFKVLKAVVEVYLNFKTDTANIIRKLEN